LTPEAEERGSVLRPPAAREAIAAAEEALGLEFPPAYRSFLEIANGADAGP
jgi:cell wall assembly regulator SMI1